MTKNTSYDVIIIGGGPAGYSTAIYTARAGYTTLVVEMLSPGGQMSTTSVVENYPGFTEAVDGFDLADNMKASADRFGAETLFAEVTRLTLKGNVKRVETSDGSFDAKTVVIATGAAPRELGIADEPNYLGRGVAYCATCDGRLFAGKDVLVVGGGNSAVADALFLSKICKSVTIVHRRDTLNATKTYLCPLEKTDNIQFRWNTQVVGLKGEPALTTAVLEDTKTGAKEEVHCDGLFVAIGRVPSTSLVRDQLSVSKEGYIVAGETTTTSIPGVFAVGDVRTKALRQIATAVGDGATASKFIEDYINGL